MKMLSVSEDGIGRTGRVFFSRWNGVSEALSMVESVLIQLSFSLICT